MEDCPYCGSDLREPQRRLVKRANTGPGRKATGTELVRCAACGRTIDGFAAH